MSSSPSCPATRGSLDASITTVLVYMCVCAPVSAVVNGVLAVVALRCRLVNLSVRAYLIAIAVCAGRRFPLVPHYEF